MCVQGVELQPGAASRNSESSPTCPPPISRRGNGSNVLYFCLSLSGSPVSWPNVISVVGVGKGGASQLLPPKYNIL